jgi:hypothetical protein
MEKSHGARARWLGTACLFAALWLGGSARASAATFTDLTLQNGWTNAPLATRNAGVTLVSGIVYFTGAIASGTSAVAFTLPSQFRPATNVYVPVYLCGSSNGRLFIQPTGVVSIQQNTAGLADAQCMTSLEGASFAPSSTGFTAMALQNSWTNAPFGTSNAAAVNIGGIVHLKGAIATTPDMFHFLSVPFVLPVGLRPQESIYVEVDMCNAARGRLMIDPDGSVLVDAGDSEIGIGYCFTSLDGVTFAADISGFTALTMQNGWNAGAGGPGAPGIELVGGMVQFKGGISATKGTAPAPFVLPSGFRPETDVYVPVEQCQIGIDLITKAALLIKSTGAVTLVPAAPAGPLEECVTLDGASFPVANFRPLALQNGWTHAPFSTTVAAVASIEGTVRLRGAIAGGAAPVAFTLPAGLRPPQTVYVPVDQYIATKGRLVIAPSGAVSVEAAGGAFGQAQLFTSLEGVSFVTTAAVAPLSPQNGWTNAPGGTRSAAATTIAGIVHLEGAIATAGSNPVAFTLPPQFRPSANVYVHVDLCTAANGRLLIAPTGAVTVIDPAGGLVNAACTTSLEGVSYPLSTGAFTSLALINSWSGTPYGTRGASVTNLSGMVTFGGAILTAGGSSVPFALPPQLRPATWVYVPLDLCDGSKGRLDIDPSGNVSVQAETAFSNAQCFTSLEGASFAL